MSASQRGNWKMKEKEQKLIRSEDEYGKRQKKKKQRRRC